MDISQIPAIIGYPLYITLCALLGHWNKSKGHNFWTGFFLSFALTPIFGFILVLMTQKKESSIGNS
jgi:phosphate starvation-inducible membrane PsiE